MENSKEDFPIRGASFPHRPEKTYTARQTEVETRRQADNLEASHSTLTGAIWTLKWSSRLGGSKEVTSGTIFIEQGVPR